MSSNNHICIGCGAKLQSDDQQQPGYVPSSSLAKEDVLCRRCFRLKHYNETEDVSMTDDDFLKMISSIRDSRGIVVHLVDIFDLNGSIIPSLPRIVGDKPIILVGNKIDLLPKSTNLNKLNQWFRSVTNDLGIKIMDVFLISSVKGHGIDQLTEKLDEYRNNKDIYIVGTTNVGKSTFINRLIKQSTGMEDIITTSYFPGTTLGFIKIPLDETSFLIDTPGIVNRQQMSHYVSNDDLKLITPQKEIKARVYQLNNGQSLFFGGLARLDFIHGNRQSFVCYFSNQVPIHRTKSTNADELYKRQLGQLLSPPNEKSKNKFPELTKSTFKLPDEDMDIVFPGLGWVTIKGGNVTVEAYSPKEVSVSIRKSLS